MFLIIWSEKLILAIWLLEPCFEFKGCVGRRLQALIPFSHECTIAVYISYRSKVRRLGRRFQQLVGQRLRFKLRAIKKAKPAKATPNSKIVERFGTT